MEQEEQDYETPLQDLEKQSGEMDEKLEQQRRDTEGVRSEWDNRQTDTGTPGAQEKESLEQEYGGDEEPGEDAGSGGDGESGEDDESGEDQDQDASTESRGEGVAEVEDEDEDS